MKLLFIPLKIYIILFCISAVISAFRGFPKESQIDERISKLESVTLFDFVYDSKIFNILIFKSKTIRWYSLFTLIFFIFTWVYPLIIIITLFFIFYYTFKVIYIRIAKDYSEVRLTGFDYYFNNNAGLLDVIKLAIIRIPKWVSFTLVYKSLDAFKQRKIRGDKRQLIHNFVFKATLGITCYNMYIIINLTDDILYILKNANIRAYYRLISSTIIYNFTIKFNHSMFFSQNKRIFLLNCTEIALNPIKIIIKDVAKKSDGSIIKSYSSRREVTHPGHKTFENFSDTTDLSVQGTGRLPDGYAGISMITKNYKLPKSFAVYNVVRDIRNVYPDTRNKLYLGWGLKTQERVLNFNKLIFMNRLVINSGLIYESIDFNGSYKIDNVTILSELFKNPGKYNVKKDTMLLLDKTFNRWENLSKTDKFSIVLQIQSNNTYDFFLNENNDDFAIYTLDRRLLYDVNFSDHVLL